MDVVVHLVKRNLLVFLFLFFFMLALDEWKIARVQADVRNAMETAEQAAIIRALDEEGFIFLGGTVGLDGMGLDQNAAEQAFIDEIRRGLHLDSNLKPTIRLLKDFTLDYLSIEIVDNYPRVTAEVTVKTKLLVAPLIKYSTEEIRAKLADRHSIVWK